MWHILQLVIGVISLFHLVSSNSFKSTTEVRNIEHSPAVDYAVRLINCYGEVSLQAGRLEIFYKGQWGTVCNEGFGSTDAHVACYSLGFTRYAGTSIRESFGLDLSGLPIILRSPECIGNETMMNECRHPMWLEVEGCRHAQDVSIACMDDTQSVLTGYPTRLVNNISDSTTMGRVEIFHNGCWGTVCDDNFSDLDAQIACRSVDPGLRKGRMVRPSDGLDFGPGEGQIWLTNVDCQGSEGVNDINIGYCAHDPWGKHDCHHAEDVAVICEYTGCGLNPCQNGATCVSDPIDEDAYECICKPGYFGQQCEQDRCMTEVCQNNGTCQIVGNLCVCPPFYTGNRCQTLIGGCESNPCQHGGSCHEDGPAYSCECNIHYTGTNCETVIGGCESNPCQNDATCVEDNEFAYVYSCICPPGYSGHECERLLYGCEIERCLNGGTCFQPDHDNHTFVCHCGEFYTGDICETALGGCYYEPCYNDGTCIAVGNEDHFCECDPRFTGKDCDAMSGNCIDDNKCLNGATCIQNGGYFTCKCAIGYQGMYCENSLPPSTCGNILHYTNINDSLSNTPPGLEDILRAEGWNAMCYLGNSEQDKQFYDTPCILTAQNMLGGNSGESIDVDPNMMIGCWFSTVIPNPTNMYMACKEHEGENLKMVAMSSNSSFVMMVVCIKYSPWPWPSIF